MFVPNLTDEQITRIKALIQALRSGEYKQTYGYLRRANGYCCLGVACDLSKCGEWLGDEVKEAINYFQYIDQTGVLPEVVRDYYGFRDRYGKNHNDDPLARKYSLIELNDKGTSFEEIADLIESELNLRLTGDNK